MATSQTTGRSRLERVRPKGGKQRHLRQKGETKVLCGIDSSGWLEVLVENREPVTCPWCEKQSKQTRRRKRDE